MAVSDWIDPESIYPFPYQFVSIDQDENNENENYNENSVDPGDKQHLIILFKESNKDHGLYLSYKIQAYDSGKTLQGDYKIHEMRYKFDDSLGWKDHVSIEYKPVDSPTTINVLEFIREHDYAMNEWKYYALQTINGVTQRIEIDEEIYDLTAIVLKENMPFDDDDKMNDMKWKGAGAVGRNGTYHPIFAFIGHGREILREITGTASTTGATLPPREKMLPGRILLVAAECGMYSLFDEEVKKALHVSNALSMPRIRALFEDLYSTDKKKVADSFKRIQDLFDMKLHMYREGDEFPELEVGFDKTFKSGLYKYPIDTTQFIAGRASLIYDGSASAFSGAIYPTPQSLAEFSKKFIDVFKDIKNVSLPTFVDQLIQTGLFTTTMGKLMEVFGEGIYIYPVCRTISSNAIKQMEKTTGLRKNFLQSLKTYKVMPIANAKIVSNLSAFEEPVRRIRTHSLERQKVYTVPPLTGAGSTIPVTGGGSAIPVPNTRGRNKGRRTNRRGPVRGKNLTKKTRKITR